MRYFFPVFTGAILWFAGIDRDDWFGALLFTWGAFHLVAALILAWTDQRK